MKHLTSHITSDQVGSITQVYSREHFSMAESRTYDVFGNLINKTGSSNGNLGFQGKYYDQESGLYYYYHRYYYPTIGRFINEDPIKIFGGLNFYSFAQNNPLQWIDPLGLLEEDEDKIFHPPTDQYGNDIDPYQVPSESQSSRSIMSNILIKHFTDIWKDLSNPELLCCIAGHSKEEVTKEILVNIIVHVMVEMYLGEIGTIILIPHMMDSSEKITEKIFESYEYCKNKGK